MIYVVGPESSGTKLVTSVLIKSGVGSDKVIHRSLPYGGDRPMNPEWPEIEIEAHDYVVAVTRDLQATILSQIDAGHVDRPQRARDNITRAWSIMGELAAACIPPAHFVPVTYESLIQRPKQVAEALRQAVGAQATDIGTGLKEWIQFLKSIGDANAKYYGGQEFHDQRTVEERIA